MQGLPWAEFHAISDECLVGRGLLATQNLVATIALVGKERMPRVLHVRPYLMGASCLQTAFHQRYGTEAFKHAPMGHGMLARVASLGEYSHTQAVLRVASYVASYGTFVLCEGAPHQCVVETACGMVEELLAERGLCLWRLRHHQETACVLVYTVHQAHLGVVGIIARVVLQMPCQCVDQRAAEVSASGMHHQACRLVYEQYLVVLVHDV